jgi:hypothetical protein
MFGYFIKVKENRMSEIGMVGKKLDAIGWLKSLRTLAGKRKNFAVQGTRKRIKTSAEKRIKAKDNPGTQEKGKNERAKGITAVPIMAANHAGLKCSTILIGVALNGSAILSSLKNLVNQRGLFESSQRKPNRDS